MTQKRRNGAVTGAELARVICRGIAEGAEQAIFGGWWRRGVPVAAGDGCRKRASGRVLRGLWRGIGAGLSSDLAFPVGDYAVYLRLGDHWQVVKGRACACDIVAHGAVFGDGVR